MVSLNCHVCGKEIKTYKSRVEKRKYCSKECTYTVLAQLSRERIGEKHQNYKGKIDVICAWCGKVFKKYESAIIGRTFCSKKCQHSWSIENVIGKKQHEHPAWLGGCVRYRGPNWDEKRIETVKRDGSKCCVCGKEAKIVHHKIPFRLFESYEEANDLSNLMTVCKKHHSILEYEFWDKNKDKIQIEYQRKNKIICYKCKKWFTPKKVRNPERLCNDCRVFKKCIICGKTIDVTKRAKKESTIKYCSKSCHGVAASQNLKRYRDS